MTGIELIIELRTLVAQFFPWLILAVARPFGFTILFVVFAWSKLSVGILRATFAIVIALPMMANGIPSYGLEGLALPYTITLAKELLIGMLLALLSSIPVAIAISAGSIVDFYRGSISGDADPSGGMSTPYASLFAVVSIWLFASIGGFMVITGIIYGSYEIWSVRSALPNFVADAGVILSILQRILLGAVVLSAPLVAIMFFSDIIHLIASKFGKKINVTDMSFASKNLASAVLLPFFIVSAVNFFRDDWGVLEEVLFLARGIFS